MSKMAEVTDVYQFVQTATMEHVLKEGAIVIGDIQENFANLVHTCFVFLYTFIESKFLGCNDFAWGKNCRFKCDCGGAGCHAKTGKCICPPGWTGNK